RHACPICDWQRGGRRSAARAVLGLSRARGCDVGLVPRTRSSHTSCGTDGCELRNRDTSDFSDFRRFSGTGTRRQNYARTFEAGSQLIFCIPARYAIRRSAMPVSKEIELKLEIPPANLPRLAKIPRLRALKKTTKSATELHGAACDGNHRVATLDVTPLGLPGS